MKTAKLLVERLWPKKDYIIGRLYVNSVFFCNTLENPDRGLRSYMTESQIKALKIAKHTAISDGQYKVVLRQSPRFKRILPLILNVKGFSGVLFHAGNTVNDTAGCILVGKKDKKGWLSESKITEQNLVNLLKQYDNIELTIKY